VPRGAQGVAYFGPDSFQFGQPAVGQQPPLYINEKITAIKLEALLSAGMSIVFLARTAILGVEKRSPATSPR